MSVSLVLGRKLRGQIHTWIIAAAPSCIANYPGNDPKCTPQLTMLANLSAISRLERLFVKTMHASQQNRLDGLQVFVMGCLLQLRELGL